MMLRIDFFLLLLFKATSLIQGKTVCYGKFGCFSNDAPFDHFLMTNPQPPEAVETFFTLHASLDASYSFKNFSAGTMEKFVSLINQPNLKVVIHGILESSTKSWVSDMTKALLQKEKTNVLVIDWGKGAVSFVTGGNSRLVGAQVAYILKNVFQKRKVSHKNAHIIGFSLGAHIAGFSGKRLIKHGYKLGRITGLDPGDLPLGERIFDEAAPQGRLDRTDADFVDNIHTDIKGLGMARAVGHLDFYPNGGSFQPECGVFSTIKALVTVRSMDSFFRTLGCNHNQAVVLFTKSLSKSSCKYAGYPCSSFDGLNNGKCDRKCGTKTCPIMGYDAVLSKDAKNLVGKRLYLKTENCVKRKQKLKPNYSFQDLFSEMASLFSFT